MLCGHPNGLRLASNCAHAEFVDALGNLLTYGLLLLGVPIGLRLLYLLMRHPAPRQPTEQWLPKK